MTKPTVLILSLLVLLLTETPSWAAYNASEYYQVAAGTGYTCALDDSGVVCWGSNSNDQNTVPPLSQPTQVAVGGSHTCALDDSGVVCWGSNLYGQTTVPSTLSHPTQVAAGQYHTCALDDSGVVCCVGGKITMAKTMAKARCRAYPIPLR